MYFPQQGSASKSLLNLPKQDHQLGHHPDCEQMSYREEILASELSVGCTESCWDVAFLGHHRCRVSLSVMQLLFECPGLT